MLLSVMVQKLLDLILLLTTESNILSVYYDLNIIRVNPDTASVSDIVMVSLKNKNCCHLQFKPSLSGSFRDPF